MVEFGDLEVGDIIAHERKITPKLVRDFAKIFGDFNPLHTNKDYAGKTRFKKPISHGLLVGSFISARFDDLRGDDTTPIYLDQSFHFLHPVFVGDTIKSEIKIIAVNEKNKIVTAEVSVFNQDEELVLEGEGTAKLDPYPYE